MKKLLVAFSILAASITLMACAGGTPDTTPPVLSGVEDVTIFVGGTFNPLTGVSAIDDVDGDISADIRVSGTFNVDAQGTYFLRYVSEDAAGNRSESTRYLNVIIDPALLGDALVPNGDFSLGWAVWSATTGIEGGNAAYTVENGQLKVAISSVAGGMWEPRLENNGIPFEQGQIYQISFDARADAPRAIHVQVGELLPAAPYFTNFKPTTPVIVDLTTEMKTFTFSFRMELEDNNNGSVLFEMGTVPGTVGTANLITNVYLDNVVMTKVDTLVDTIAPVLTGVADGRIGLGSMFDPLEGVTVSDNVDGEIAVSNVTVTGEVDVDTLGEYTLTYTVEDAAGNEAVVTRVITVGEAAAIDLSGNPDYGWRVFVNNWEGTSGSLEVVEEELVLTLDVLNVLDQNWKIQVIQDAFAMGTGVDNEGSIQLEAGKTYKATFDVRASTAGEVTLAIGHGVNGWVPYFTETFNVTTEMETITIEFTLDDEAADYSVPAQFKFEFGLLFAGAEAPQTFVIDNVTLDVQEGEAFVATTLIVNGDFAPRGGLTTGWRAFTNNWEGTVGSLSNVSEQLVLTLDVINAIGADNWKIQIIQDAFALGTGDDNEGSIQFEAGKTYKVSFDAKASVAGEVNFVIGHAGGGFTGYFTELFNVTTTLETYTFEFTLDGELDYSVLAQFKIEMGLLFAGLTGPQSFTLDNVKIQVSEDGSFVDTTLIINGDFKPTAGYRAFLNDWEGTAGSLSRLNGALVLTLETLNALDQNWKVQIIQDAFALGTGADNVGSLQFEAGKTYKVSFDAKASVAGQATFIIGHAGGGFTGYVVEAFNVTTTLETYTFEFTLDGELDYSVLAQFKIEMGLLFAGLTGPQSFTLDNIAIEVSVDGTFVDAQLIINGDME